MNLPGAIIVSASLREVDLRASEDTGFALNVPAGGPYAIETLGRLHTAGQLATDFLPQLGAADGNGVGQNMLMAANLRAGRYRVDVRAVDGSGHLAQARPSLRPRLRPRPLTQTGSSSAMRRQPW